MGKRVLWISLILVLTGALNAQAGVLTSDREAQLEAWLGMGDLEFTPIYVKGVGDNSREHFHPAVDGKGPTITLLEIAAASEKAPGQLVGGYNPNSWNSPTYGAYNETTSRDAFIFNLTTGPSPLKLDQLTQHQTYNDENYGPTFGGGGPVFSGLFDLYVQSDLTRGTLHRSAYGRGANLVGETGASEVLFADIEVYTFEPASTTVAHTPEPGSLAILSVLGVVACGRYRRSKAKLAG